MNYRLIIQPNALDDLEAAYQWLQVRAPAHAVKWFNGFVDALEQLKTSPESFALSLDIGDAPYPIRELLYGKRKSKYRIIFAIRNEDVVVLYVHHAARKDLEP